MQVRWEEPHHPHLRASHIRRQRVSHKGPWHPLWSSLNEELCPRFHVTIPNSKTLLIWRFVDLNLKQHKSKLHALPLISYTPLRQFLSFLICKINYHYTLTKRLAHSKHSLDAVGGLQLLQVITRGQSITNKVPGTSQHINHVGFLHWFLFFLRAGGLAFVYVIALTVPNKKLHKRSL